MRKISLFLGTALMALMLMPSVAKADGSLNLSVFGIDVTDENAADILGDGQYKAVYDVETRTLTLSDLVINFAESDYNVSEGSVVEDRNDLAENGPLLVVINGHCEFTNTYLGFSSGFGINFSAAADGGELVLSGEQSQISADQVTIDGVDITAISSFGFNTPAVNAPDFLSILPNSHLVARSTNMGGIADDPDGGIAIVTAQLDMDESLEILTEGVHFYYNEDAGGSFYTDEENTSFAREVEIGKSKEMADLVFEDEAYYASLGCSRFESPVVSTLPEGLPVTYSSDDEEIATVDAQTGEVTLVAPGEVNICASFEGNDEYEGNEACYILYVEEAAMTEPSLEFDEWSQNGVYAQLGMDFEGPALVNPEEVTISWSSSNEEVATVDEEGNITIVGIGETVISADFAGDACFSEAHAEYTLIVGEPQLMLRVLGVEVTMDNADDILADGGSVSYDLEVNTVRFDNVTVDFAEMPDSAQFIIVGDNEVGGPLEVNILGKCEFKNVSETGFAHPIGFRFWGSATDTLLCSGSAQLFESDRMFIEGLYAEFIADADLTVNADELHVKNNGHLLVKELNENGYAIQTYDLDLDDNIQILTKGVEFYLDSASWEAGFYLDADHSVLAREVEIGKAPVVVADDEVTTIDFTQTNPDGTEEVVISLGVEDNFNEATGQLEISTTLTDEEVAEALETLVPGSSAFIAALPGSITFDIPAGQGDIDIQCVTLPGYTLNVKIEGQAAIKLTQTTFGWAHVSYDVEVPVHVVLYLHADAEPSPAPARVKAEAPAALCIQAIKITPANAANSIENVEVETFENGQKFIIDGTLYIVRDGRVFNATGMQVK